MRVLSLARLALLAYRPVVDVNTAFDVSQGKPAPTHIEPHLSDVLCDTTRRPCFFGDAADEAQAYFFPQDRHAVLAVRGTDSLLDCIRNVECGMASWEEIGAGVQAHGGMLKQYRALKPLVAGVVMEHMSGSRNTITFTGHSSGAAISAFGALEAAIAYPGRVSYVGFASPKVVNRAFSAAFRAALPTAKTFVNGADPICKCFPGYSETCDVTRIGAADPHPHLPSVLDISFHSMIKYVEAVRVYEEALTREVDRGSFWTRLRAMFRSSA
ncbi:Alpha/Beta hydrolase protein [Tribonema minus]|uniref:Alpha/Beta hydrolase protein n=1 Tax=Tribonema minus TaxID=303371 RepID=A0A835YYI4_9STRA|nr:Alpha/Beta hydrolase protein [Tribonema minus]